MEKYIFIIPLMSCQCYVLKTCPTSLSEVQSSIKEVTSAIANYVSSTTPGGSKERLNTDYQDTHSG